MPKVSGVEALFNRLERAGADVARMTGTPILVLKQTEVGHRRSRRNEGSAEAGCPAAARGAGDKPHADVPEQKVKAATGRAKLEKRAKPPDGTLHWEDCPRCGWGGEYVSPKYELVMCSRCVCLLIPYPYAHADEWKEITYGEGNPKRRVRG